jgi:hypothetical protein
VAAGPKLLGEQRDAFNGPVVWIPQIVVCNRILDMEVPLPS